MLNFFFSIYRSTYFFLLDIFSKFFNKNNNSFFDLHIFVPHLYSFFFSLFTFIYRFSFYDFIYLFFLFMLNNWISNYCLKTLSIFFFVDFYFFFILVFCFLFYMHSLFNQYYFNSFIYNSPSKYILIEVLSKSSGNIFFVLHGFLHMFHKIFKILFFFYVFMTCFQFFYFLYISTHISCIFLCHELLMVDCLICFVKVFISVFSFCIYIYVAYSNFFYTIKPEFFFLFGFSILSLNFLLMSYNLISMFLSLEIFSTSIIILARVSTPEDAYKDEAVSKYFVINCLASVFFLFSITLIYGFFGTFSLKTISTLCLQSYYPTHLKSYFYLCFSFTIFFFSFSFKLILVPFHQWIFEVYSFFPSFVNIFLIVNSKLVFFTLIYYFLNFIFSSFFPFFSNLFVFFSFLTMFISCDLALTQIFLIRFLISVSLINTGIILFSLTLSLYDNGVSFFLYLIFDSLFFLFFFIFINFFYIHDSNNYKIHRDFSFFHLFYIDNVFLKCVTIFFLLSLSGLPPFGVFFLKFTILLILALTQNYFYFVLIIFFSIQILILYIRPIKLIFFFNENKDNKYFKIFLKLKCSITNYPYFFIYFLIFVLLFNFCFIFYYNFFYFLIDAILFTL